MRTKLFSQRFNLLLALPSYVAAVSLADMAPRASNLPAECESIYISQVPHCTPQDFRSGQCSQDCIHGMESLVKPIEKSCGNRGITGQNLIVAYLAHEGPQQICHNAPPSSGNGLPTTWPSEPSGTSTNASPTQTTGTPHFTSTSTAKSETGPTTGIDHDTTPPPSSTSTTPPSSSTTTHDNNSNGSAHSTRKTVASTTATSSKSSHPSSSSSKSNNRTPTSSLTTTSKSTRTSTSSGNYQTNMHDGSGGGSPFDTLGNLGVNAASGLLAPQIAAVLTALGAAVLFG